MLNSNDLIDNDMMVTLLQSVARLAQNTFNKCHSDDVLNESIAKLTKLLSQVTHSDVNLNRDMMTRSTTTNRPLSLLRSFTSRPAPVTYLSICDYSNFSMSVFALRHHMSRIPLHDHPGMYGFIKVIFGSVRVSHYTALPRDREYLLPNEVSSKVSGEEMQLLVPAILTGDVSIDSDSKEVCTLTPSERNFHQITAINGPAAIFDLLAPPYNHRERECHYYTVVATVYDKEMSQNITWLLESVEPPDDYWCDSLEYNGPQINL